MKSIKEYNNHLEDNEKKIAHFISKIISENLPKSTAKIWHGHPVWFIEDNPIVGYSQQKAGIRLMFWSGQSFEEELLNVRGEKFMDASIFYTDVKDINDVDLKRWLHKSEIIQWDYKNLVKRKGKLEQLTKF